MTSSPPPPATGAFMVQAGDTDPLSAAVSEALRTRKCDCLRTDAVIQELKKTGPRPIRFAGDDSFGGDVANELEAVRRESIAFFFDKGHDLYELMPLHRSGFVDEKGHRYVCAEQYFQAQKFMPAYPAVAEMVRSTKTGMEAKSVVRNPGYAAYMRPDWDDVRVSVMKTALRLKFAQNLDAQAVLIGTGSKKLVAHSSRGTFWEDGGDGSGQNMTGTILEELRAEFQGGGSPAPPRQPSVSPSARAAPASGLPAAHPVPVVPAQAAGTLSELTESDASGIVVGSVVPGQAYSSVISAGSTVAGAQGMAYAPQTMLPQQWGAPAQQWGAPAQQWGGMRPAPEAQPGAVPRAPLMAHAPQPSGAVPGAMTQQAAAPQPSGAVPGAMTQQAAAPQPSGAVPGAPHMTQQAAAQPSAVPRAPLMAHTQPSSAMPGALPTTQTSQPGHQSAAPGCAASDAFVIVDTADDALSKAVHAALGGSGLSCLSTLEVLQVLQQTGNRPLEIVTSMPHRSAAVVAELQRLRRSPPLFFSDEGTPVPVLSNHHRGVVMTDTSGVAWYTADGCYQDQLRLSGARPDDRSHMAARMNAMRKALEMKFSTALRQDLLRTGDRDLVYCSRDRFWGTGGGGGGGENFLGKMLQELREQLRGGCGAGAGPGQP